MVGYRDQDIIPIHIGTNHVCIPVISLGGTTAGIVSGTDTTDRSAMGAVAVVTDCSESCNVAVTSSTLQVCILLMPDVCPTDYPVMTETLESSYEMSFATIQ